MALAGKAAYRAVEAVALSIASELSGISDDIAMDSREGLLELEELIHAIRVHLEETQSTIDTYSKKLQEVEDNVCGC